MRTLARAWRRARIELQRTFRGLTWSRLGIFALALFFVALSKPSFIAIVRQGGDATAVFWGAVRPFGYILTNYGCVLLAVLVAENRGARSGWRRVLHLGIAVVVGQVAGYLMFVGFVHVFDGATPFMAWVRSQGDPVALAGRLSGAFLSDLIMSIAAVVFWYFLRRDLDAKNALQDAQMRREAIERETAEARFAMMQAQIEPHFLFNTLASIRRLYETDAHAGRAMLQHLSRYLTASLPVIREARSTLGREVALALAYLGVQKIRMGARLAIDVDVPAAIHGTQVPTMMLATLVENAVIHGLSPLPEGGTVRIAARLDGPDLVVEVTDTGRGFQGTWGSGVGLTNIRMRLATTYGDRGRLALTSNEPHPGIRATLRFPSSAGARSATA